MLNDGFHCRRTVFTDRCPGENNLNQIFFAEKALIAECLVKRRVIGVAFKNKRFTFGITCFKSSGSDGVLSLDGQQGFRAQ